MSYTSLINLCYKYLGYCLGVNPPLAPPPPNPPLTPPRRGGGDRSQETE
ncbi:hypothetical protein [Okeania sp. SIO1I7]|nr:hypothetical protein [Okeania sp. SIO1I7]NET28125.1 hypothetical protein [Okeania sp. SIO1I7]